MRPDIKFLIKNEDWEEIIRKYTPEELVINLSFREAMILSKWILGYIKVGFDSQSFAVDLINAIKSRYSKEWKQDWRHEAYLGYAYRLQGWHYDRAFDAYKVALEQSQVREPELLICMAVDWDCPGVRDEKIDKQTAINWLEEALKHHIYPEGVFALAGLYNEVGNAEKKSYWSSIWENCDQDELRKPHRFLYFLNDYEKSWNKLSK